MHRSMKGRAAWAALFVCALVRVAAAQAPGATLTPAQKADLAEERAYRLTGPALQKATAATKQFGAVLNADPGYRAIMKAADELDSLRNKLPQTAADKARIAELEAQTKGSPFAGDPAQDSLSDIEAQIAKMPPVVGALEANGLAPREYVKLMVVSMQAVMAAQMQQAGAAARAMAGGDATRAQMAAGAAALFGQTLDVAPENISFVTSHMDAVQQFMTAVQAIGNQ